MQCTEDLSTFVYTSDKITISLNELRHKRTFWCDIVNSLMFYVILDDSNTKCDGHKRALK